MSYILVDLAFESDPVSSLLWIGPRSLCLGYCHLEELSGISFRRETNFVIHPHIPCGSVYSHSTFLSKRLAEVSGIARAGYDLGQEDISNLFDGLHHMANDVL